jgi:DNA polymerase-3 subunit gamma/tau
MPYQPFILKYRPRTFADVVGQEHISRTLRNALAAGKLVHAYLFTGPRGTGKTTMARILARALNCVNGPTSEPCGVCDQCVSIIEGRSMDIIEIDAASHRGIDDIRELREGVKYGPTQGQYKLYILDECHMLTPEANNALLKTLEEPPAHAYFALLTTEAHKIIPTILSRCQRFDFRPVSVKETVGMLRRIAEAEGLAVQDEALIAIAHAAEGGMRDAESIFEQVVAFSEGEVTLEIANQVLGVTDAETLMQIADLVARQDLAAVFPLVDRLVAEGKNLARLVEDLTSFFRDLLRLTLSGTGGSAWLALGPQGEERMRQVAQSIGGPRLLAAVHSLAELSLKLKDSAQHALLLELALTELSNPAAPAPKAPGGRDARTTRPAAAAPTTAQAGATPQPAAPAAPSEAASPGRPEGQPAAQPAPQSPPRPAPMALDGPLTCEAIWSHWESVMDELRRMGLPHVRAFIVDAVPTALEAGNLVLSFPAQCQFHASQLKRQHKETVQKALHSIFGQALAIEARICAPDAPPQPPGAATTGREDGTTAGRQEEATAATSAPEPEPAATPTPTPLPTPAAPQAPTAPAEDFELQAGQPEEPPAGMSVDEAAAQALTLFAESQEITTPEQNP